METEEILCNTCDSNRFIVIEGKLVSLLVENPGDFPKEHGEEGTDIVYICNRCKTILDMGGF